jgi:hypothetical protein
MSGFGGQREQWPGTVYCVPRARWTLATIWCADAPSSTCDQPRHLGRVRPRCNTSLVTTLETNVSIVNLWSRRLGLTSYREFVPKTKPGRTDMWILQRTTVSKNLPRNVCHYWASQKSPAFTEANRPSPRRCWGTGYNAVWTCRQRPMFRRNKLSLYPRLQPKRWYLPTGPRGVTTHETNIDIFTAVRTSNIVHHHIQNGPLLDPILSQLNPVHNFIMYFSTIST